MHRVRKVAWPSSKWDGSIERSVDGDDISFEGDQLPVAVFINSVGYVIGVNERWSSIDSQDGHAPSFDEIFRGVFGGNIDISELGLVAAVSIPIADVVSDTDAGSQFIFFKVVREQGPKLCEAEGWYGVERRSLCGGAGTVVDDPVPEEIVYR